VKEASVAKQRLNSHSGHKLSRNPETASKRRTENDRRVL
jgi:hypothetical protein